MAGNTKENDQGAAFQGGADAGRGQILRFLQILEAGDQPKAGVIDGDFFDLV